MNTGRNLSYRTRLFLRNGYRVANVMLSRWLGRAPHYLPVMLFFVTNRCNLRCKMCGVCEHDPAADHQPELTLDEWKTVVRSAEALGTTLISVTGGEPLLRPDLYELLRCIHDRGLAAHMCTNGVLLNRENVLLLRDSGVDAVSVSIESTDREIHESLRGPGSFDRAVAGVRLLRELAPAIRVGINYLITTANFRNMAAMIPFAEGLGVHQVKFAPIHTNLLHRRKRIESYGNLIFVEEDLEDLNREVRELVRVAARSKIQTTSTMFFSGIAHLYSKPKRFRCYAGYAACAINPSGAVTPCCDMESTLSVRDKPLEEIWRSPEFHELRKKVERCDASCWDTTNTELSLRLRPGALIIDALQTWRDVEFYFKDGPP